MELESFLACARGLLTIPSTADRPDDLYRALEFVLDVVGPGFTVERFESRGKPSALVYLGTSRPRPSSSQGVDGEFVIIGEQSRLRVVTESRGLLTACLRAEGRSAYQWLGDNAIRKLMSSLDKLLTSYPVATEEVWRTTVNLARIETTNSAVNQIPADAQAWLDIRFPAEDTDLNGRTVDEITEHLTTFCVPGVTVAVTSVGPPCRVDHQRHEVRLLQHAARNQGYRADVMRKHGASDSRFFSQRGIDAVIFGIGGDGRTHSSSRFACSCRPSARSAATRSAPDASSLTPCSSQMVTRSRGRGCTTVTAPTS